MKVDNMLICYAIEHNPFSQRNRAGGKTAETRQNSTKDLYIFFIFHNTSLFVI